MCWIDNDINYEDSEWDDELDAYEDEDDDFGMMVSQYHFSQLKMYAGMIKLTI